MSKSSLKLINILSISVLVLIFLYLHFYVKNTEYTHDFIKLITALAIALLNYTIMGKTKADYNAADIKEKGIDQERYFGLLEKEHRNVSIGTAVVFLASLFI